MAIVKAVSSRASIGTAIKYITQTEKTEEKLISGINCTPVTAIDEMNATKELWNKTGGRQYKHFVQSFSPEEKITPEQAHKIALELMQERYKDYEIIIATHQDRDHIHSHIIVNSVSFQDGHKLQQSRGQLEQMKDRSNELCKEYGLTICEKGKRSQDITTYDIGKYKALDKASTGEYKSYVLDTALSVSNAKEKATSRTEFVELMKKQGYETNWTDNRKYITFVDKDGNKVRNSNLEKTFKGEFGKEQLENEFRRNQEREQRTNTAYSKGTTTEFKQAEQSRAGEQLIEGDINGISRTIQDIENGAKQFSATSRESAEPNERDNQRPEKQQRDIELKHKDRNQERSR